LREANLIFFSHYSNLKPHISLLSYKLSYCIIIPLHDGGAVALSGQYWLPNTRKNERLDFPALKGLRKAELSHGFVILESREFLTKLKKADMRLKQRFKETNLVS